MKANNILKFFVTVLLTAYSLFAVSDLPVVSRNDARFSLKDATFFKRISTAGKGQELNVTFEVHNRVDQDIKLNLVLIAFHETTATDPTHRELVQYPEWRRDLDEEIKYIAMHDIIPGISKDEIEHEAMPNQSFPSFVELLDHLDNNPTIGVSFTLRGIGTPAIERIEQENITIDMQSMKTTIWAKLRMGFDPSNRFFNHYGAILIDPESGQVVASRLYHFQHGFRIY